MQGAAEADGCGCFRAFADAVGACLEASRSSKRRMCSEKSSPFSRASRCAAVSCCGCRAITATLRDRPLTGAGLAGLVVRLGDADVRPCGPFIDPRLLSLFERCSGVRESFAAASAAESATDRTHECFGSGESADSARSAAMLSRSAAMLSRSNGGGGHSAVSRRNQSCTDALWPRRTTEQCARSPEGPRNGRRVRACVRA